MPILPPTGPDRAPFPPRLQRVLAALSLTVILTALLANARQPYLMDFASFWAAARLAVSGAATQAYDVAAHHQVQLQALPIDTMLPFAYPPPYLLAITPLGWLPYPLASPVWVCATLLLFAIASWRLLPGQSGLALAFPAVALCAITGQNGLLTAAVFFAAMATMLARPWLAGLLIACLAMKPQLAVLMPLALMAGREWRAFAVAAVGTSALCLVSLATFGTSAWQGFFAQAGLMGSIATENLVGWEKMASVYASLRLAGVPNAAAWVIHLASAAVGAALVWQIWRRTDERLTRAAILAPASLLVSPYLYIYDQVWLGASFAWLGRERFSPWLIVALLAVPLFSAVQFGSAAATLNPAPLLTLTLLGLVAFTQPWGPPREHPRRHAPRTGRS